VLENLENIKLVFPPVNNTRVLQPMDQGMTRSLKCRYHKLVFLRMIELIEKKQYHTITLLDGIRCIEKAGRRVTDRTIRKYFRYAGIRRHNEPMSVTVEMMMMMMMMMICLFRNRRKRWL